MNRLVNYTRVSDLMNWFIFGFSNDLYLSVLVGVLNDWNISIPASIIGLDLVLSAVRLVRFVDEYLWKIPFLNFSWQVMEEHRVVFLLDVDFER